MQPENRTERNNGFIIFDIKNKETLMAIEASDLTDETYNAILLESEKFDDNLTLQFGLLTHDCDDETDFINQSEKLIKKMLKYNNNTLDDLFFGEPPSMSEFHKVLKKMQSNIERLRRK